MTLDLSGLTEKECVFCECRFYDNTRPKNRKTCSVECAEEARKDRQRKEYRKDNPVPEYIGRREALRRSSLRRMARVRRLPDDITHKQIGEIRKQSNGACALSGNTGAGHLDHVIPISIGHGGTTYENMIPLRADLNISKSDRNLFEWFADNRERFELSQTKFDELIEYLAEINEMTTKEYRDFVYWCHDNPRTAEEIEADNERYGYMKPSSEIWREEVANKGRELVEA